jgi:hypothetical protein
MRTGAEGVDRACAFLTVVKMRSAGSSCVISVGKSCRKKLC